MQRADQQLIAEIASGNAEAFAIFFDRHSPTILGLAVRMLGQTSDAEDVLQESFLQVWNTAARFDAARSTPRGWVAMIARSRSLDRLRRRRAMQPLEKAQEITTESIAHDTLEQSESKAVVNLALAQLSNEQCSAIRLAFYDGLTYEQVAIYQGIPVGTAKTRIRSAVQRLRSLLIDQEL